MEVTYSDKHWETLRVKRSQAAKMMKPLFERHMSPVVYGSIARGDISETSDVDVFIPILVSPTIIEATLESNGIRFSERVIIQATPSYVAKAYLMIDDLHGYSFPLIPMRAAESEFTRFAGQLGHQDLVNDARTPGVNKSLMLITPTEMGHTETSIKGVEGTVAKQLGVDTRIVNERVRTLERREKVGRTGVYIKRVLAPDESFSGVFETLTKENPGLRRRIRKG